MEIPITAKAALLQALLVDGPGYGTELAERIETRTKGSVKLLQGSIYPALEKFLDEKLVESYTSEPPNGGRERVYYKLTRHGEAMASEQQEMMLSLFSRSVTNAKALAVVRAANLEAGGKRREAAAERVRAEKAAAAQRRKDRKSRKAAEAAA